MLSDYPDVPLVAYMANLAWIDEDEQQAYLDAYRELVLPQTEVLVGNHQTLTDFLLPDWSGERPASPRELAVAAGEHGTRFVLVTSVLVPSSGGADQYIDNVLASPQGAITGEKFERFDVSFVGAGDTLSAALAALLASGADLHAAVGESLTFLDQALDAGFRPGMGNVIPDRFFWALPPGERRRGRRGGRRRDRTEGSPPCPLTARAARRSSPARSSVIPGGVNSPVRAFRAVGGTPRFIARAEGAYLWDADGQRYIDYIGSWGPMILGHGHPAVLEAVMQGGARGPVVRRADRARGRARRGDPQARAEHGAGPPRQLGHRGGDERDPPGARRHRPLASSSSSRAATTATPTRCW